MANYRNHTHLSIEDPPIRLTDISSGLLLAQNDYGDWGYVCFDNWNQLSSDIACRQLGYANAISFSTSTSYFDLDYPSHISFQPCSPSNFDQIYNCSYTYNTGYYSICGNYFVSLECNTGKCTDILILDNKFQNFNLYKKIHSITLCCLIFVIL